MHLALSYRFLISIVILLSILYFAIVCQRTLCQTLLEIYEHIDNILLVISVLCTKYSDVINLFNRLRRASVFYEPSLHFIKKASIRGSTPQNDLEKNFADMSNQADSFHNSSGVLNVWNIANEMHSSTETYQTSSALLEITLCIISKEISSIITITVAKILSLL